MSESLITSIPTTVTNIERTVYSVKKTTNSLTKSGYVISKEAEPFVETIDNYVGYNHLKEKLTYDYSKFEEN